VNECLVSQEIPFPKEIIPSLDSTNYMKSIRSYTVARGMVALWFLGQNGFLLKDDAGFLVGIDPYLSDSCASGLRGSPRVERSRLLPVFVEPEDYEADLVLITHSHQDHVDPETIKYLKDRETRRFVAPWKAASELVSLGVPVARVATIHPGETMEVEGLRLLSTFAEPTDASDLCHSGFLLRFPNGKTFYNTGDTANSPLVGEDLKGSCIDFMTVCVNGGYGNLSHWEAAGLAGRVGPKKAMPCHHDMMPHNSQSPIVFKRSLEIRAPGVEYREPRYYEAILF
jgi:L-ascorbate 6-phosphate lactonase